MGELLPADAFDHMDVGGRDISGTIAEIELVRDGIDDFLHRALADNRFLHNLHFPHSCGSSKSHSHSGGPRAGS